MNQENQRSSTRTRLRCPDPSPSSGMCPICVEGCKATCDIGLAAIRGREALYPDPDQFGRSTAASNKDYGISWGDFQIVTRCQGAQGIAADEDLAIFPNVATETKVGGIPIRLPVIIAGLGSTEIAQRKWEALAQGAGLYGTILTVGENVCGMDPAAVFEDGRVVSSPQLKSRIDLFRHHQKDGRGGVAVQVNVEDSRASVADLAIQYGVDAIEIKLGQGAKAIGGEVRVRDLERACMLKQRGYIMIPDPEDEDVVRAFKAEVFSSFERHSRVGMPTIEGLVAEIKGLKKGGVRVFLKTGAYWWEDVAFVLTAASLGGADLVTFDGAGGGTGMSPVPMMQECGTPTIYLLQQVVHCAVALEEMGFEIPDIAIAGGFTNETQIFKALALGAPYVKAVAMARAPLTAIMRAEAEAEPPIIKHGDPADYVLPCWERFYCLPQIRKERGESTSRFDPGGVGLYSYFDKLRVGLQQLLAGCRKWDVRLLNRMDLTALAEGAHMATGVRMSGLNWLTKFSALIREMLPGEQGASRGPFPVTAG